MLTGLLLSAIIYHVLNGYYSQNKNKAKFKGGSRNMKKTNRFIALLTALVLVFSTLIGTTAFAKVNEDVAGTDFEVAVGKLQALKIMEGYPDGTFLPNGEITRAEFAKIAVLAYGLGDAAEASKGSTKFADVPGTHWASGYINLAVNRGLVSGYPDGSYKPENKLTYAEAITILVRLVGLGPVVDKDGTWPANYIGRAANEGILKDVNVAAQTNATRGTVAVMLVNSLEVEVWGASGYNNDGTVDYGPLNKTLLTDTLEVTVHKETRVADYDTDDNELNLRGSYISNGWYDVATDINFEELYLEEVKVWINDDDEVIFAEVTSDSALDAIEFDGDELTLVDADEDYDISDDVTIYVDGEEEDLADVDGDAYDYAKVVFDGDGDVLFVNAFKWVDFLVVEKVDGDEVLGYGDELDVEDYTIVKDGKTIAVADLAKGDILFFSRAAEYAEVFNKSVTGAIERIYDDRIRVEGEDYTRVNANLAIDAKYMNEEDEIANIDSASLLKDIAEAMEDEGDVTVFVDRNGDMVYLVGGLGDLVTTSTYNLLTSASSAFNDRGTAKWTLDVLNSSGTEVDYDVEDDDVDENPVGSSLLLNAAGTPIAWAGLTHKLVVEIKVDTDGDVDTVQLLTPNVIGADHKTSLKYYSGMAIASSTPVFLVEDYTDDVDDIIVTTYGELDFDYIKVDADSVFYSDDNEIVAIVVGASDRDEETTDHQTVATSDSAKVAGKDIWRLKLVIDGAKADFETKEDLATAAAANATLKGDFLEVKVDDDTGKVNEVVAVTAGTRVVAANTLAITSTSDKEFTIGGTALKLGADGVVVDATDSYKVIAFSSLKDGDTVKALRVANNSTYTSVLVRTAKATSVVTPTTPATSSLTGPTVFSSLNEVINVKVNVASGKTLSDYKLLVRNTTDTTVEVKSFVAAAGTASGQNFTGAAASLNLAANKSYTLDVIDNTTGTVVATKNITSIAGADYVAPTAFVIAADTLADGVANAGFTLTDNVAPAVDTLAIAGGTIQAGDTVTITIAGTAYTLTNGNTTNLGSYVAGTAATITITDAAGNVTTQTITLACAQ